MFDSLILEEMGIRYDFCLLYIPSSALLRARKN